jgi:hypothetical protein
VAYPQGRTEETAGEESRAGGDVSMLIGLVDVDGHNFPNLALMKLSAWHKAQGDCVEWAFALKRYDRIYMSKVFTFTPDDFTAWMCDDIRRGGTGYDLNNRLPDEVEHMMPDYSLYGITDTAYGFLTRGCPRGCPFCIVAKKEGRGSRKVADLREWWGGQKMIKLLDPNITACSEWQDLFGQLKESGAWIDFTQGIDIRLMTEEKVAALNSLKVKAVHFAWDGNEDLEPLFRKFSPLLKLKDRRRRVYVLTNFNTTRDWDFHRIYTLRNLGYDPYMMIYNRENADKEYIKVQRWVNNKFIFWKTPRYEDYNTKGNYQDVDRQPNRRNEMTKVEIEIKAEQGVLI